VNFPEWLRNYIFERLYHPSSLATLTSEQFTRIEILVSDPENFKHITRENFIEAMLEALSWD
jgi:hypothetical protein